MLLLEIVLKGLVYGSMYALMAIGLTLVYGLLRILHIAHAGLFTLGAFLGVVVTNATGSLALGFVVAIVVAAIAGALIYRLAYQPVLKQPPHVPMIISIGVLVMMEDSFRILFGGYGLSFKHNPYYQSTVQFFGIRFTEAEVATVIASLLLLGLFSLVATRTRIGLGWRATVTDPAMASAFGVDPIRVRYANFIVGSSLGAVAGVLIAILNNYVEPGMGATLSYKGLAIIVLGGLGNVRGTLVASLLLGVVENLGSIYLTEVLDRDAIGFLFLIIVLMIRPQGLVGK
jgi:branched-chain amino acid transport system permease protein